MKKVVYVLAALTVLASAGGCRNVTVTGSDGVVHTVLICD